MGLGDRAALEGLGDRADLGGPAAQVVPARAKGLPC